MDTITKEQRSRVMAAIRSRDTLPEIIVRKWLHANGFRFRCQYRRLPGRPDVALPRLRTLIEVRGCFWHQHGWAWDGRRLVQAADCPATTRPKSNRAFWNAKFRANVRRDARHEREWAALGWNVIIVWECALAPAERERTFAALARALASFAAAAGRERVGGGRGA